MYKKYFKKALNESGANIAPTAAPGTSLSTFGPNSSLGGGSASGTPGTDKYAAADTRTPKSIFGGIQTRSGLRKRKKKKK